MIIVRKETKKKKSVLIFYSIFIKTAQNYFMYIRLPSQIKITKGKILNKITKQEDTA